MKGTALLLFHVCHKLYEIFQINVIDINTLSNEIVFKFYLMDFCNGISAQQYIGPRGVEAQHLGYF